MFDDFDTVLDLLSIITSNDTIFEKDGYTINITDFDEDLPKPYYIRFFNKEHTFFVMDFFWTYIRIGPPKLQTVIKFEDIRILYNSSTEELFQLSTVLSPNIIRATELIKTLYGNRTIYGNFLNKRVFHEN